MPEKTKHLDARGKGEFVYDYINDILIFKTRDRNYFKSIDFDNFILDVDNEGFITGIRVFDATKIFGITKIHLKSIKEFEFNAKIEDKVITFQLRFTSILRNKPIIKGTGNFVREALHSDIEDSELVCTATA